MLRFLQELGHTHLVAFDVAAAIETVRKLAPPKPYQTRASLRSRYLSAEIKPKSPRLADDLSERITAGFCYLRSKGAPKAGKQVADALNRCNVPCNFRDGGSSVWTSDEVLARVKQYEKQAVAHLQDRAVGRQRNRSWLVPKWLALYQPGLAWEDNSSPAHRRKQPTESSVD